MTPALPNTDAIFCRAVRLDQPPSSHSSSHVQHAALENQMEEERRSRESKLRDRLAKKRKVKEEDMQKAATSEMVRKKAQNQQTSPNI